MTARKVACILLLLAITVTGCNTQKSVSVPVPEPVYWPTEEWQNSTPEAQGMDSNLLAQMLEEISTDKTGIHSVLVIRNGYLVTEAYFHPYQREHENSSSIDYKKCDRGTGRDCHPGWLHQRRE